MTTRDRSDTTETIAGLFLAVVAFAALRAASEGRFRSWLAAKFLNTGEPAPPASSSASLVSNPDNIPPTAVQRPGDSATQFGDPVPSAQLVSVFGDPRDGGRRTHMGIDLAAPRGTPVRAVADGTVSYARGGFRLCGTGVKLRHGGGWESVYCHLDTVAPGLDNGGRVFRGDVIGTVGNTGNAASTGPHLHFELRRNGESVNPQGLIGR